jgi:hypothetical protein
MLGFRREGCVIVRYIYACYFTLKSICPSTNTRVQVIYVGRTHEVLRRVIALLRMCLSVEKEGSVGFP